MDDKKTGQRTTIGVIVATISTIVVFAVILGVILGVICLGVSAIFGAYENWPHDVVIGENTSIISLCDTNSVSGSFLIGCGQIHGEMRYSLYIKVDNDGIKMKQIPVDNTIIYEDTESNPYLTEYNLCQVFSSSGEVRKYDFKRGYPYYELHVPFGTIIQQYSLNGS